MQVTVDLPESILSGGDPKREVYEAVLLQAYSRRRISHGKLAALLALSYWETEQLLAERGINIPFTDADIQSDLDALKTLQ